MSLLAKEDITEQKHNGMKEAREKKIPAVLDYLEASLESSKFVNGDSPSIADFQLYCEVLDYHYVDFNIDNWSKVVKWCDACRQEKGLKEVHDKWDAFML